jgi:hypothetical protein
MRAPQPTEHDTYLATAIPHPATEIRDTSTRPTHTRSHPQWCDRQHCATGDEGARHASTPTHLITGEQTFALTLIQHDPDGEPELLIEITDTAEPDGLQLLTLPEIKTLAETLLVHYLTAASSITPAVPARRAAPPRSSRPRP